MKKIFIYLFGLLIAFASCAKVTDMSFEDLRNEAPQEVVFNLNTVKVTRAMVDSIQNFTEDFGVYAYIKEATNVYATTQYFMQNARYHGYNAANDSLGKGYKKYFWPKSDDNSDIVANFVAYYPYDADNDTVYRDDKFLKYKINTTTVKDSVKDITDVMFAVAPGETPINNNVQGGTDTITKGKIPLHFKHALSLIQFQGKKDSVITNVTINKIYFSGKTTGTGNDSIVKFDLYKKGELSIDITNPFLPATITTSNDGKDSINFAKNGVLDTCYKAISTTVIIPQTAPEYVTMEYDIELQYKDGTIEYQNRKVTRKIRDNDDNGNAYLADAWKGGYRYIYRYYVTVEEIKFDVKVDPWTNTWNQVWDHDTNNTYEVF